MIPPVVLPPEYTAAENVRTASEAGWDYTQLALVREVGGTITRTKAFIVIEREFGLILAVPQAAFSEAMKEAFNKPRNWETSPTSAVLAESLLEHEP